MCVRVCVCVYWRERNSAIEATQYSSKQDSRPKKNRRYVVGRWDLAQWHYHRFNSRPVMRYVCVCASALVAILIIVVESIYDARWSVWLTAQILNQTPDLVVRCHCHTRTNTDVLYIRYFYICTNAIAGWACALPCPSWWPCLSLPRRHRPTCRSQPAVNVSKQTFQLIDSISFCAMTGSHFTFINFCGFAF